MAGFPPFMYQAILRAEGKIESEVYAYLNQARAAAVALSHAMEPPGSVEILGVVPAALARRANYIRAHLLIQASTRRVLQNFLRAWQADLDALAQTKLRCSLDIDPLEF
jgi:primosomal protein N' (replication factor Y)